MIRVSTPDGWGTETRTTARTPRLRLNAASVMRTLLMVSLVLTVSCGRLPPGSAGSVAPVRVMPVDTVILTRLDTIQLPAPAAYVAPPSEELAALRRQVAEASAAADRYRAWAARTDGQLQRQRRVASILGDSIKQLSTDSARVDGYKEMLEGQPYVFTLSLARNMVLPEKAESSQEVLRTARVSPLAESAKVCLNGPGFEIVADVPSDDKKCSVQTMPARSQRQWSWTVTPDSINRAKFKDPVERVLIFTVISDPTSTAPTPKIVYRVTVRIRRGPWPTELAAFLKTTTGIVSLLTGLATAVGALWAAVGFGKRTAAANAAS